MRIGPTFVTTVLQCLPASCVFFTLCFVSLNIAHATPVTYKIEDGLVKEYFDNGVVKSERNFRDGQLHGISKLYYPSGKLKEQSTYKDDKLHGSHISYFENGNVRLQTTFKDGFEDGVHKEFYQNGVLKEQTDYREGVIKGDSVTYYESGKVMKKSHHGNFRVKSEEFYESGKLMTSSVFKNTETDNSKKVFYTGGALDRVELYEHQNIEVDEKQYYESGKVKSKSAYTKRLPSQNQVSYYNNGQLVSQESFIPGTTREQAKTYPVNLPTKKEFYATVNPASGQVVYQQPQYPAVETMPTYGPYERKEYGKDGRANVQTHIPPDAAYTYNSAPYGSAPQAQQAGQQEYQVVRKVKSGSLGPLGYSVAQTHLQPVAPSAAGQHSGARYSGHSGHGGHAAHPGHSEHAGHAAHPGHSGHAAHAGHSDHYGHNHGVRSQSTGSYTQQQYRSAGYSPHTTAVQPTHYAVYNTNPVAPNSISDVQRYAASSGQAGAQTYPHPVAHTAYQHNTLPQSSYPAAQQSYTLRQGPQSYGVSVEYPENINTPVTKTTMRNGQTAKTENYDKFGQRTDRYNWSNYQ